jgi:hypothetical protein
LFVEIVAGSVVSREPKDGESGPPTESLPKKEPKFSTGKGTEVAAGFEGTGGAVEELEGGGGGGGSGDGEGGVGGAGSQPTAVQHRLRIDTTGDSTSLQSSRSEKPVQAAVASQRRRASTEAPSWLVNRRESNPIILTSNTLGGFQLPASTMKKRGLVRLGQRRGSNLQDSEQAPQKLLPLHGKSVQPVSRSSTYVTSTPRGDDRKARVGQKREGGEENNDKVRLSKWTDGGGLECVIRWGGGELSIGFVLYLSIHISF